MRFEIHCNEHQTHPKIRTSSFPKQLVFKWILKQGLYSNGKHDTWGCMELMTMLMQNILTIIHGWKRLRVDSKRVCKWIWPDGCFNNFLFSFEKCYEKNIPLQLMFKPVSAYRYDSKQQKKKPLPPLSIPLPAPIMHYAAPDGSGIWLVVTVAGKLMVTSYMCVCTHSHSHNTRLQIHSSTLFTVQLLASNTVSKNCTSV